MPREKSFLIESLHKINMQVLKIMFKDLATADNCIEK